MVENKLAKDVIGISIDIHKHLGPGLVTSAYRHCLLQELKKAGYEVELDKPILTSYKDQKVDTGCQVDMMIDRRLILGLTSIETEQINTMLQCLRLGDLKLGLLIDFNASLLKDGIKRVIL